MKREFLVTLALCSIATSGHAVEYHCPQRMTVKTQIAAAVDGFESLNTDETSLAHDAHFIESVGLFSGHPREMAELVPDNEYDTKHAPFWTTPKDAHGYWMACYYTATSLIYSKKIDNGTTSCTAIESSANPKKSLGLECK